MLPRAQTLLFFLVFVVFLAVFITRSADESTEPPFIEVKVRPQDKMATFPITWPDEYKGHLFILVKKPGFTEVAMVTWPCIVKGANSYRERVHGISGSLGVCNVVLSVPGKEDEGMYETHDSRINGTLIRSLQFKLIFEDNPRSGDTKTVGNNKLLIYGAVLLAVYTVRCLP